MIFDQYTLPITFLLIAAVAGVLLDRAVRIRRRSGGDRGDLWVRAVWRVCVFLALPVLLSSAAAIIPSYWQTGRHLLFDVTGIFGWPLTLCYRIALLLPFVVWALLLLVGLTEKPGERGSARWLAGSIGFGNSRLWVLIWIVPLAFVMGVMLSELGGGAGAYPAAAWSTQAVLMLSLIGVALSAGEPEAKRRVDSNPAPQLSSPLQPWPEALSAHGVTVRSLTSWPAATSSARARLAGSDLAERLRLRGANAVAPELVKAVEGLLGASGEERHRSRLVLAPDDCGEVEVVALAAELLDQRFHAATLILTASGAATLAARLKHWLPAHHVSAVNAKGEIDRDALIVVADAQILSDRLLPQLKSPALLERFGLIVWWHLEAYTGVLAANLWAISRRLHRLLEAMGRHDLKTLVFVRSSSHGGAQLAAFARRLLPHPFEAGSELHIHTTPSRDIHLHLLESHEQHFQNGEGRDLQERYRHLPFVATKVSVEERWPTRLEVPGDIPAAEAEGFLQLRIGEKELRESLKSDSAFAAASIREVRSSDALSLLEIIGHGGRSAPDGLPHHVAVTRPSNPYVTYLLSTLNGHDGKAKFSTARRLVCAEAQPSVVRGHLLLALDELPDTRSGLLRNFLWNEEVIDRTLEEIANEGKLSRREVRFLDDHNELQREPEYSSRRLPTGERRPLDTVGSRLIEVRDPSAGYEEDEGVLMLVDPERLTIQAYPHRRFVHHGQRYRILEWSSIEEAEREKRVLCVRDGVYSMTWRIRSSSVFDIKTGYALVGVGREGRLLTRVAATLRYEENVAGALRLVPGLTSGEAKLEKHQVAPPIAQGFSTRAIILRFPGEESPLALVSLAQALRHILPVHIGVEEDALDVVPFHGETIDGEPAFGLAIVDLYPGGIGLVDAIGEDNMLHLQMLEWARDWLTSCPCQSDKGCSDCLRSPAAMAANSDLLPARSAALNLLRQIV